METGNLMVDAQTAFARERRRHRRERATGWLLRRPAEASRLSVLEQELGAAPPAGRRAAGLRAIPLDSIVGTAERSKAQSFDRSFRPPPWSRHRWERLWIAGRSGAPLPPIYVFRLGEQHFVGDGHHRVSVARALGMTTIDAEVIELGWPRRDSRAAGGAGFDGAALAA
jgi:hypothetical protein